MKYSYSSNGEDFHGHCASIGEAISEACDDDDMAEIIYVGEAKQKTIGEYLAKGHIEALLEDLSESASDECGECAEDWLIYGPKFPVKTKEQSFEDHKKQVEGYRQQQTEFIQPLIDDIKVALEKWATENDLQPGFWHVDNVKEYDRDGNLLSGWQQSGRVI